MSLTPLGSARIATPSSNKEKAIFKCVIIQYAGVGQQLSGRRIMNAKDNGFDVSVTQASEEMKSELGESFSLKNIKLAALGRRTGVSRAKLRRLKDNGFKTSPHALANCKKQITVMSRFESFINNLLYQGVTNSSVLFTRLKSQGYTGSPPSHLTDKR